MLTKGDVAIYLAGNGDSINKTMAEFYSASTQYLKLLDFLIEKLKKPIRRRKGIWTKAIIKALSEIYTEATGKHVKYGTGVEDICGDGLLFIVETMRVIEEMSPSITFGTDKNIYNIVQKVLGKNYNPKTIAKNS